MKKFSLIPFTCGLGGKKTGCERGPLMLDQSGIAADMRAKGFDIDWIEKPDAVFEEMETGKTHESAADLGSEERKNIVLNHVKNLAALVESAVEVGNFPITIGGDHTMAAGSIAGLTRAKHAQGRTGLIWIDAHPDLNTLETTPSHAYHGMPVALLLGMGDADFSNIGKGADGTPPLKPEHICYMGIRDIDDGEEAFMKDLPIRRYDMDKINEMGVHAAFEDALSYLAPQLDHLCLSFDIDALDPAEGLAAGTPVANGFRKDELFPVLEDIMTRYDFDLFEIAEYNPALPHEESTRAIIFELLEVMLRSRNGQTMEEGEARSA